ncbi:uncharacterized protein [Miscanthus floridulus]|uniref:uncharacterized protein n=1 Tax=Miscanthus floridulus TaxID=154761 RepID=UPI00345936DF
MVDPIVGTKWLAKVLMDGGSGLNIMYTETLNAMGIDRAHIRPTGAPFHDIMLGKKTVPLGQVDLPITFKGLSNYRVETLTFEVVGFLGTYHSILGQPCYAKFMAIPNYTYLILKMSGPGGVITISTSFQCAYECKGECCDHAVAIVTSREIAAIRKEVTKEAPDPKQFARSFEPAEGTKEVLIDPGSPEGKVVRIGTMLSSK